jgi:hypothetical protein
MLRAGRPGFDSRQEQYFSFFHTVQTTFGNHPASYPMATGDVSTGMKRPGDQAYRLPSSSTEVKNFAAKISLPHMSSWLGA